MWKDAWGGAADPARASADLTAGVTAAGRSPGMLVGSSRADTDAGRVDRPLEGRRPQGSNGLARRLTYGRETRLMSAYYTLHKLGEAVRALIGPDPLQDCLASAGQPLAVLCAQANPVFPDEDWDVRLRSAMARLTQDEGLESTTRNLTESAAKEIATEIFDLYECAWLAKIDEVEVDTIDKAQHRQSGTA